MARKYKIRLQQSHDLEAIDAELASAMNTLDKKNDEVTGLLAEYAPPPPPPETPPAPETDAPASDAAESVPGNKPESP